MNFEEYKALSLKQQDIPAMQKRVLLPLVQEEKEAFIKAEYGRLQSIMGTEYHEGEQLRIFHPLPEAKKNEERPLGDPNELELAELAMLPHLSKRIPRMGTISIMPLFRAYPADIYRLQLLADLHESMMIGRELSDTQVKQLLGGHAEYMMSKQPQEVIVIK